MSTTAVDAEDSWLEPDYLATARRRLPMVYINAVPVRLGADGEVVAVGLLLRGNDRGEVHREIVSGRVMFHETIRAALLRHAETDLGPVAMPRVPASPQPFTVAEYFPTPGATRYHDPRQHAVALCYILPVAGDTDPRQDALTIDWFTPAEVLRDDVMVELAPGQDVVLRQALAHVGVV